MSRRKDGRPRSFTPATTRPTGEMRVAAALAARERLSLVDPRRNLPAGLTTDEFFLRPILASDAARDHEAVMETQADLRVWEQSSWPEDDFTVDANRADLADLERGHTERRAFTYTVLDAGGTDCLGCVYIFPTTATFLTKATVSAVAEDARWDAVDAVVYFWVRASRIETEMDARLLAALTTWLSDDWALAHPVFVTSARFERQVELLEGAGMRVEFELREPAKPATYLVYG